jgi:hypothetical protein
MKVNLSRRVSRNLEKVNSAEKKEFFFTPNRFPESF